MPIICPTKRNKSFRKQKTFQETSLTHDYSEKQNHESIINK